MTWRLTRAEIILLHGVLGLYRDDLTMIESGPEEAKELEFCELLLLKLETMREETPGLAKKTKMREKLHSRKSSGSRKKPDCTISALRSASRICASCRADVMTSSA